MNTKDCCNCKYRDGNSGKQPCVTCGVKGNHPPSNWEEGANYVPMTNADRIRAMSDEELLEFLQKMAGNAYMCSILRVEPAFLTLDWLQQPAKEETT